MQNDKCRHLRKQEGEKSKKTLLNRDMNGPESLPNREMNGSDQFLGSSGCQLTVSEQCHKSTNCEENG